MKIFLGIIRVVVGILFIFSGIIKANDPLGLCYKMQEFFDVLHFTFLSPFALTLAVIMIGFEIIAGVALLLGFKMRIFGTLLLLLMILFLFLTAYAFLSGKIKKCGCFGDCIPIPAEASFWKDVILFVLVLFLFAYRKKIKPVFRKFFTGLLFIIGIIIAFGTQWYTLNYLPVVDCLAYKVGNNIQKLMQIPPGATPNQYATFFVYEKNGVKKEFNANNIPWQDTAWHYVSREDKLIKKGDVEPPIVDFVIKDFNGNDSTQAILNDTGYTFLFVTKNVNDAGRRWRQKIEHLQSDCQNHGIKIYGITASGLNDADRFIQENNLAFPFFQMDGTVIKTMARNNPVLILLKAGTIEGKWSYNKMPSGAVPDERNSNIKLTF
ncbi:MAG: DoxX family protein [Chitinophagaceae bacterium]|nr:MAG: DoxX family protein [Chitinophagaceae bacterium]